MGCWHSELSLASSGLAAPETVVYLPSRVLASLFWKYRGARLDRETLFQLLKVIEPAAHKLVFEDWTDEEVLSEIERARLQ